MYKDAYIGREKPEDNDDLLIVLKEQGKIQMKGNKDFITDEETIKLLFRELPEYFNENTVSIYTLHE